MIQPLAISTGDPAGIGPELIAAAWDRRQEADLPPFFVTGGSDLIRAAANSRGLSIQTALIKRPSDAVDVFGSFLPILGDEDIPFHPGTPDLEGAKFALQSLQLATSLAVAHRTAGLVTGPVAKAQLGKVGFSYPGQTEFVAHACDIHPQGAVMMLAGPNLRAVPVTVHTALANVPQLLSRDLIKRKASILAHALARDFGIPSPRIAVAGLNPHAGEEGRMGDEEALLIGPVIAELRSQGFKITGPHPADALFTPRMRQNYDAALCMYHDQALIPLKTLDFDEGVNVTLGLPIIRTSPDHGTAFPIAGKNQAHPGAMIAAIRMAGQCATRRGN